MKDTKTKIGNVVEKTVNWMFVVHIHDYRFC